MKWDDATSVHVSMWSWKYVTFRLQDLYLFVSGSTNKQTNISVYSSIPAQWQKQMVL